MQLLIVFLEQRRVLLAPHRHVASHHRLLSFESAQFLLALAEQSALGTFSSLLPPDLAALLRSAFFFTGALFFARPALSRSAFHGFYMGFQAVQRSVLCRSRRELSHEYLQLFTTVLLNTSIYLHILASIQQRSDALLHRSSED